MSIKPDEGLATLLLGIFARHRKPDLCERLVEALRLTLSGFPIREWHIAPLIAAYTSVGRYEDAIKVFAEIESDHPRHYRYKRRDGTHVTPSYTSFLDGFKTVEEVQSGYKWLSERLGKVDAVAIDIPIQFVNAVMKACIMHDMLVELREFEGILFRMLSEGAATALNPDIATFNIIFSANLPASASNPPGAHVADIPADEIEHLERLMQVLRNEFPHLKPTKATYTSLAETYARGPEETWELAFDYLEEMKYFNIAPPARLYLAILNRLVTPPPESASEDPYVYAQSQTDRHRVGLILQEMAALGYLSPKSSRERGRSTLSREMINLIGEDSIEDVLSNLYKRGKQTWLDSQTQAQRIGEDQPARRRR